MNREIKYRGWHKFINGGGCWVYGYFFRHPDGTPSIYLPDGKGSRVVVEESIGQYIGRKDKNGVDIYESDVIKCNTKNDFAWEHSGNVVYLSETASFAIYVGKNLISEEEEDLYTWFRYNENFEIIGNIYQNPELLTLQPQ